MVASGYLFYTALFLWPTTRTLLELDISDAGTMMVGIIIGVIGAAVIEATWWVTALVRGERRVLWQGPAAQPLEERSQRRNAAAR